MSASSHSLVKEFCQSIGMEGLGLDENNQRSLSFDEKVVVTLLGDDTDLLTALCFIADSKANPNVLRKVLEQNFLAEAHGGGRFALEPGTDRIVMTRNWNSATTTKENLSEDLEAFVNSAMQAQEYVNGGAADAPAATEAPAAPIDSLSAAYQAI